MASVWQSCKEEIAILNIWLPPSNSGTKIPVNFQRNEVFKGR